VVNDHFHTTTGNSLTAMVGVDALLSTCVNRGAPLAKRLTGVIGAYGSVGRLASLRLGKFTEHLVLLGNAANQGAMHELRLVGGELYATALRGIHSGHPSGIGKSLAALLPEQTLASLLDRELGDEAQLRELFDTVDALVREHSGVQPPVVVASDLGHWLPKLEAVLSATSNGSAFIDPAALHHNAIICDCAQPPDIGRSSLPQRPDVTVIEGGLIHLPERGYRFGNQNLTDLPTGVTFSCLAETMVLTMAGKTRDYSIGKRPPLEEAEAIFELALHFGFAPAVEQLVEMAG
jgi:predicted amino acid dehydrogenase